MDKTTAIHAQRELDSFKDKKSRITANALFNFMPQYNYLEKILNDKAITPRYYPEEIGYLNLKFGNEKLNEWYIPMTCFCDIPLHQIHMHAEGDPQNELDKGYGKFAIAFHKKFAFDAGIQPVHYINHNSVMINDLTKMLNYLFEKTESEDMSSNLTDFVFEYIRNVKPYSGRMQRRNKENEMESIEKNFQDEHEWRYIPKLVTGELPLMLISEEDIRLEKTKNLYSNNMAQTKLGKLAFEVKDIKYIFVDSIDNRDKLIRFIRKRRGNWLSKMDKDILISKILVYDELKEDW